MHTYNHDDKFLLSIAVWEVPSSCVTMQYYDEPASLSPNYEECYDKGGRIMYSRDATHLGTCAEKIPCGVTSENVHILHYVCESVEDYYMYNNNP